MTLDELKLMPKGEVKIYKLRGNSKELILEKNNAILPTSKDIMALALTGDPLAGIDMMNVYNGTTLLYTLIGLTTTPSMGIPIPEVEFQGVFTLPSFSGIFDSLTLGNSNYLLDFSELDLTASPITKNPTEQILIIWKIKFI